MAAAKRAMETMEFTHLLVESLSQRACGGLERW